MIFRRPQWGGKVTGAAVREETVFIIAKAVFVLIFAVAIPLLIADARLFWVIVTPVALFYELWRWVFSPKKRR